jgi:hypothetical protein
MTITVLTSASGSPGVTTTALGLTLQWPGSCMLVDGDYQQAVLTGYLQGRYVTSNGMIHVINAARISPDVEEAVWRQSFPLPDDEEEDGLRRLLLPGLSTGQAGNALYQSWPAVAAALRELGDAEVDAVVDYGRMTWQGVHPALIDVATHVLLMTRPTMRSAGAAFWAAQRLVEQAHDVGATPKMGLLLRRPTLAAAALTGHGREEHGYSDREIEQFLPLPVRGSVVYDPASARLLSDGGERGPKFAKTAYATSLTHLAQHLKPRARHGASSNVEGATADG